MYEDQTYEVITSRKRAAIKEIDPTIDTREGSLIHLTTAIDSAEMAQAYIELDTLLNIGFADTAPRDFLIRRAAERGLKPKSATKAIVKGVFSPSTLEVSIGVRFSSEGIVFKVIEKVSTGVYKLQAEQVGIKPNSAMGNIVPVLNVPGLETCRLTELLIPGENDEDTEVFRQRYFDSFDSQAFGGNIADYTEKINNLPGVGGVKVYPVWNGGGTVKCVILNSEYSIPSAELIAQVQETIDPVPMAGQGAGLAPIGHTVTIAGVMDTAIDITSTITYQDGWDFAAIEPTVNTVIDNYLKELNQTWQSTKTASTNTGLIVRISQIETRLLDVAGVLDIGGTTINALASNLTLGVDEIAIRGVFSG